MRRILLAVAVMVGACSPDDALESTTTTEMTTTLATSTSLAVSTSVTVAATTTTTTSTTSTTLAGGLEGNWAAHPLITTGFGALGWWDGRWLSAEDEGELPVAGGEDYQVVTLGAVRITRGGPQLLTCAPLDRIGVELEDPDLLGEWPGPYGVAISAPWEVRPHLFESITDNGIYAGLARDLLAARGLPVGNPRVKQLYRLDLEGDGINEVLVVVEDIQGDYLPRAGDYSMVFLRRVAHGVVHTAILGESVNTDETTYPIGFSVGGVGDLSGDGKMEIVVNAAYFEGIDVEVWEYVDDDRGPVRQLDMGCGS